MRPLLQAGRMEAGNRFRDQAILAGRKVHPPFSSGFPGVFLFGAASLIPSPSRTAELMGAAHDTCKRSSEGPTRRIPQGNARARVRSKTGFLVPEIRRSPAADVQPEAA